MLSTSARLLKLLVLLQSRPSWPGGDLAQRLEVTPRSLRRDVERLRELGYPVESVRGVGGGYRLGAGRQMPPLLIDDEEAVAIAVALQSAAAAPVADIGETALRALSKLEQVLPDRLRRQVEAVRSSTVSTPRRSNAPVRTSVLVALARACRDAERVRFDYTSGAARSSRRHIEPFRLVNTGWRWYLVAFDVDRAAWRTFRVDRLAEPTLTGARFVRGEAPDAAETVARAIGSAVYPCRATVRLQLSADDAAVRLGPAAGPVEAESATTSILHTGAPTWANIACYLGLVDVPFEVIEPDELRIALRHKAADLLAAAEPAG